MTDSRAAESSAPAEEVRPEAIQTALGPTYELGRLIGHGGSASVYAVRNRARKQDLAVKVIRPSLTTTAKARSQFVADARTLAALRHRNIVAIVEAKDREGLVLVVMPLVRGESLEAVLAREGKIPLAETRRILTEAAAGLEVAHRAGIIHRDLKPGNIMLGGTDRTVLLMDFGITATGDELGPGQVVGTPEYMSPEQIQGGLVDARSDQYSLAVVGYRALAGRLPFDDGGAGPRALMAKHLVERPPIISGLVDRLPQPFAMAIHRALEKDPTRRFESMAAFARALADPTR